MIKNYIILLSMISECHKCCTVPNKIVLKNYTISASVIDFDDQYTNSEAYHSSKVVNKPKFTPLLMSKSESSQSTYQRL